MALNIKDEEAERLAAEVAALTDESKTRAVRVALKERRDRLALRIPRGKRHGRLRSFLAQEVWPQIPAGELDRPLTREEREQILGYGAQGV